MRVVLLPLAAGLILAAAPAQAQHAGHGGGDSRPQSQRDKQAPAGTATQPLTPPTGPRQAQVTIGETGFEPKEIQAEAGDSVTLYITRVTDATCAKEVNFSGRGIQVALPMGQEVKITVDVNEPGMVRFGCLSGADGAVIRVTANKRL
jgi:plastocyanin